MVTPVVSNESSFVLFRRVVFLEDGKRLFGADMAMSLVVSFGDSSQPADLSGVFVSSKSGFNKLCNSAVVSVRRHFEEVSV